jgi:hypothetical protein
MPRHFLLAGGVTAASFLIAANSSALPTFAAQQALTTDDYVNGVAGISDSNPAVATNGTDFLVAWSDNGAIEAARYSVKNGVLDTPALRLGIAGAAPAVFWDGTKYLVVSPDNTAQRVDPASGAVGAMIAFQVGQPPAGARMALGGGLLAVVVRTASGSLAAVIEDETGALVKGDITVPAATGVTDFTVAATGAQFLVAWTDGTTVKASRLSTAGVLLDATPIVLDSGLAPTDAGAPVTSLDGLSAAASPGGYLVTWHDPRTPWTRGSSNAGSTYGARVDMQATVADSGGLYLLPFGQPSSAAWDGATWWISTAFATSTLDPATGAVATTQYSFPSGTSVPPPVQGLAATPSMALGVGTYGSVLGLLAAPPSQGIVTPGSVNLSQYLAPQSLLCAAASPDGYLVTLVDGRTLVAARFDTKGNPLDQVFLGATSTPPPAVACGAIDGEYIVAMSGFVASMSTHGATTPNSSFLQGAAAAGLPRQFEPLSMTCVPSGCLLAYAGTPGQPASALLFQADGQTTGQAFEVTPATDAGALGALLAGTDGSSFLIAESGALLPVASNASHGSLVTGGVPQPLAMAGAGGLFVLADSARDALYGFGADGAPGAAGVAGVPLPIAPQYAGAVSLAWDGKAFFGAQSPSDGSPGSIVGFVVASGAFTSPGAGAGSAGTDAGAQEPLFTSPGATLVASDGAGHVAVFSTQPQSVYATPRAVGRFAQPDVDQGTDGGVEAGSAEAGTTDAGAPDASSSRPDGGAEAGEAADGGADAESSGDGGAEHGGGGSSGCGCRAAGTEGSAGGAALVWVAAGAGLLAMARRRRARQSAR